MVIKGGRGAGIVIRRKAKGGNWRRSDRFRNVVLGPGGKVVLGTSNRFVLYLGSSVKSAVRTDWVLHEYAPVHHFEASFVLCEVYVKSH